MLATALQAAVHPVPIAVRQAVTVRGHPAAIAVEAVPVTAAEPDPATAAEAVPAIAEVLQRAAVQATVVAVLAEAVPEAVLAEAAPEAVLVADAVNHSGSLLF